MIHISRLHLLRTRDPTLARRILLPALHQHLPSLHQTLSLPPEAELILRQLHIRLHIRAHASDTNIGNTWTTALLRAILRLTPTHGWNEEAALFPDRLAVGREALQLTLRHEPAPWWVSTARLPWTEPSVGDGIVSEWLSTAPERVPHEVSALLTTHGPQAALRLFSPAGARQLSQQLLRARSERIAGRRPSPAPQPATPSSPTSSPRSPTATTSATPTAASQPIPTPPTPGPPTRPAPAPPPAWTPPPWVADLDPDRRQWVTLCLAWAAAPWLRPDDILAATTATPPVSPGAIPADGKAPDRSRGPSEEVPRPPTRSYPPHNEPDTRAAPPEVPTPTDPTPPQPAPTPNDPNAPDLTGTPVTLAGLLFLLRWLVHTEAWDDPAPLPPRLRALADALLDLICAPLPPSAAQQVRDENLPVLAVFCGRSDVSPAGPSPWLDDLRAALPPDLPWRPACMAAVHPDLLTATWPEADQPLVHLLARPGHLTVTRTHADLTLSPDLVDFALRLGGWDLDPGWVPELGRVIRFHYMEAA